MLQALLRNLCLAWASAALVAGCASDALTPPEARIDTPGAFVAVEGYYEPGELTLVRILDRLQFEEGRLLFMTIHDARPETYEEARELAKDPELPIRDLIRIEPDTVVTQSPHQVVWFRTLTKKEQERVP
ncbi:hypothetical protein [Polyangium sp. y55x31]|uniref:hypothetical protein n=1 Tax=Polyangium sp. y55x31 TaxID=3042688 RepID=UPI00248232E6|nr:hypothetical protein [Polyangium sp. y55x31]MDI1475980.1 hypothetical protein [Polyangium sp. y55x31]